MVFKNRNCPAARPAWANEVDFLDEGAVLLEHLDPVVLAFAQIDEPVLREAGAVDLAKSLRRRGRPIERGGWSTGGRRTVGVPAPLVLAGRGVEDHQTMTLVAFRNEHLVCRIVHIRLGDLADELGVVVFTPHPVLANLHHELPGARELQYDESAVVRAAAVAFVRHPDIPLAIDIDAVFRVRPLVLRGRLPAPGLHDFAVLIELNHRRCRDAAVGRGRRALARLRILVDEHLRPVKNPHMVAVVHGDAADAAQKPVVRQRLRPVGIDLVFRHTGLRLLRRHGDAAVLHACRPQRQTRKDQRGHYQ